MNDAQINDFGRLPEHGDIFEYAIDLSAGGTCRLVEVVQTERGPQRRALAEIAAATWRKISVRVVRELVLGMGETERARAAPKLRAGVNRLSPLIGRELAVLLWALNEDAAGQHLEAILHGWRELAREERWWLYAKAAAPGQEDGMGWRRALFHALAEAGDSRAMDSIAEKKSPYHRHPKPSSPPLQPRPAEAAQPASTREATAKEQKPTSRKRKKTGRKTTPAVANLS